MHRPDAHLAPSCHVISVKRVAYIGVTGGMQHFRLFQTGFGFSTKISNPLWILIPQRVINSQNPSRAYAEPAPPPQTLNRNL